MRGLHLDSGSEPTRVLLPGPPGSEHLDLSGIVADWFRCAGPGIPTQRGEGGRGEKPESADFAEPASGRSYPNEP
jgi:hypothetical protein